MMTLRRWVVITSVGVIVISVVVVRSVGVVIVRMVVVVVVFVVLHNDLGKNDPGNFEAAPCSTPKNKKILLRKCEGR
jgi:hypothetical protein